MVPFAMAMFQKGNPYANPPLTAFQGVFYIGQALIRYTCTMYTASEYNTFIDVNKGSC